MRLYYFDFLEDAEKEELLWNEGSFVTTIEHENIICDVYKIYNFYVSLTYEVGVNRKAKFATSRYPENLSGIIKIREEFKSPA